MEDLDSEAIIADIIKKDPRYTADAYEHIKDCVEYAQRKLKQRRHITCLETLAAIRAYTLENYGPMSRYVLSEWGITNCADFGNIIHNLVVSTLFGKSESDDFAEFGRLGFDFVEAFDQPYKPNKPATPIIK